MSKSFEEEFPNIDRGEYTTFAGKVFLDTKTLTKHCLDKARVKEAINNCIHRNSENKDVVILAELYKELGLEWY